VPDTEDPGTVVLEHARTGQPLMVCRTDYLAAKDGRYANWRLLCDDASFAPPPLPSEQAARVGRDETGGRHHRSSNGDTP
jgi:hypothetical protein